MKLKNIFIIVLIMTTGFSMFAREWGGSGMNIPSKDWPWSDNQCRSTTIHVSGENQSAVITQISVEAKLSMNGINMFGVNNIGMRIRHDSGGWVSVLNQWGGANFIVFDNFIHGVFGGGGLIGNPSTNPNGVWTLEVCNSAWFDEVRLHFWNLFIVSCGDGREECNGGSIMGGGCDRDNFVCTSYETCDGNTIDCSAIDSKYYSGSIGRVCNNTCTGFSDTLSNCKFCGDGAVSPEFGELCDPGLKKPCSEIEGHAGEAGMAKCSDDCQTWDFSTCAPPPQPGQNKVMAIRHFSYAKDGDLPARSSSKISAENLKDQTNINRFDSSIDQNAVEESAGWFITLPRDTLHQEISGETMLIGSPVYCAGKLYFTTYVKHRDTGTSGNVCSRDLQKDKIGWSFLWEVYSFNGNPVKLRVDEDDERIFTDDRIAVYLGRGVASEPVCAGGDIIWNAPGDIEYNKEMMKSKDERNPPPVPFMLAGDTRAPNPGTGGMKVEGGFSILWWKIE